LIIREQLKCLLLECYTSLALNFKQLKWKCYISGNMAWKVAQYS